MRTDHYLRPRPPQRPGTRRRFVGPAILAGALGLVGVFSANAVMNGGAASISPSPTLGAVGTTPSPGATTSLRPSPTATSSGPSTPPSPTPVPTVVADVPIVPVTNFRSGRSKVGFADLDRIATGSGPYEGLTLVEADADAILAAIHEDRATLGTRLRTVDDPAALAADLRKDRDRLGFLRVSDVTPAVRTLAWGSRAMFGVGRVPLTDWALTARLETTTAPDTDQPLWTLVAGGDILLDRGVAVAIRANGVGFPFDGGTVEITGHCKDCSPLGWDLPYTRRTGNKGVVREFLRGADVTIANFENPAPDRPRFHASGTVFSADPRSIKGLKDAGLDWVSLANNHIGDAGRPAILQTIANLKKHGLKSSGAGKDITAARAPASIEVGDVTVALFGYDSIARSYKADADSPGSVQMSRTGMRADIRKARANGADVVIVFPHWGAEYDPTPFQGQRQLAHAAIDAGADMVIGNHAHWAGAIEVYEGKPIWYALGNFVFDQSWSEPTMEGVLLELTFRGSELVQAKMRPHLILDKAQPNFMDPLADGRVVLSQMFGASQGLLPW